MFAEITKISLQKRKSGRVNVHLDGKFAFSLSEDVLLDYGLRVGDTLPDDQLDQILKDDLQAKILSKTLDFISYQLRTEREVKDKLSALLFKNIPDENLRIRLEDEIFTRIADLGLINDVEYAKSYVSGKELSKNPPGSFKLKQFLLKKGVDTKIIDSALANYDNSAELKGADAVADKKLKTLKKGTKSEKKAKLWRFLASKGYSSDVIRAVVDTKSYIE